MIRKWLRKWLTSMLAESPAVEEVALKKESKRKGIDAMTLHMSKQKPTPVEIEPYEPPAGVIPQDKRETALAMDSADYSYINAVYSGAHFKGYPYLALLSQYPEYRKMAETIAKQMTRKWIKVCALGDGDKSGRVKQMEDALKNFRVRALFRKAAELDGFFGRGQIFIDVKTPSGTPAQEVHGELETILLRSPAKITKDSLIGFKVVEPVWTYPSAYDANNPLAADYYKPTAWYVMGKTVHASRLLMFSSREVPDMLKASYNFGGLSMSQLAEPYVNNWLRTRDSVSDMVHSFSVSGIKTNLGAALSGSVDAAGMDMFNRADLFNNTRDNRGVFMLDMETEEFFQFNTPLSGLDALQAQAQEQMSSVSNIPLIYLLGITPSGLNATAEGELEVFESYILSMQESIFSDNLDRVFEIIQLSEFGEIDPEITYEFEPLSQMDPEQKANIEKVKADTDAVLVTAAIISPDDARERLIGDPDSSYNALESNPDVADIEEDEPIDGDE